MKIHENMNSKGASGDGLRITRPAQSRNSLGKKSGNPWNVPRGDTCRARQRVVSRTKGEERNAPTPRLDQSNRVECRGNDPRNFSS